MNMSLGHDAVYEILRTNNAVVNRMRWHRHVETRYKLPSGLPETSMVDKQMITEV